MCQNITRVVTYWELAIEQQAEAAARTQRKKKWNKQIRKHHRLWSLSFSSFAKPIRLAVILMQNVNLRQREKWIDDGDEY